jgi:RNA recognition motif-containing protein
MAARLYIEGLPGHFDEDDLLDLCEPYGEVYEAAMLDEQAQSTTGSSAIVDYEDLDDARRAAEELDGYELDGLRLNVSYAPRKRKLSSYD